jgi:putative hemolysin
MTTTTSASASQALIDAPVFPHHADGIPPGTVETAGYVLRFAWTRADLQAVQALRYRVFNGERRRPPELAPPAGVRLDDDPRDAWFHHLMICTRAGDVVGTYRMQTTVMAATRFGFYSAAFFELGGIPAAVLDGAVEVGRAAVDPDHRSGRVLRLLWRGLARYLQWNDKRFLFGCCSIPGTSERTATDAWRALHARRALHDRFAVRPRPEHRALADDGRTSAAHPRSTTRSGRPTSW